MRIPKDTGDDSGVPTLSELISERKTLRGFSYADLENRASSVITRQRWQQLGTGVRIKEFPEPATLEAMATALDVDVAEVVLAAARSIGLDVKRGARSDLAARLPSTADRLSLEQRDAIVTLVRSITETSHDQPATQPARTDRPTSAARTPRSDDENQKINKPTDLSARRSRREALPEEDPADAIAARPQDPRFPIGYPDTSDVGEESQDPGDE